jgi:hypothetical protein
LTDAATMAEAWGEQGARSRASITAQSANCRLIFRCRETAVLKHFQERMPYGLFALRPR